MTGSGHEGKKWEGGGDFWVEKGVGSILGPWGGGEEIMGMEKKTEKGSSLKRRKGRNQSLAGGRRKDP